MFFATRGLRLLLALLLVLSQQQAVLHLLGHDLSQLSQKQDAGDPQERVCAKCLSLAHLDHALSPAAPAFVPPSSVPGAPLVARAAIVDLAVVAPYRSRAPPLVS